jgi:archaeosine-15-forming tRNA-guanine transglycosylase
MLQQDYIVNTEDELLQIKTVKELIQRVYNSDSFFNLSLRTLELIRRFNNLYIRVFVKKEDNPGYLNQLVITARGLENSLLREN